MFVCAVRGSTLKFFGVTTLAVIALVALLAAIPMPEAAVTVDNGQETVAAEAVEQVRFDKVKTADDRIAFLKQFGWEVEAIPVEEVDVTIPTEFDKIYQTYNELQKKQGFDLGKFGHKTVKRFTYKITNYPDYKGTVWANLLIYKNKVVGGDVCTEDTNGFIHGLDPKITF